MKYALSIILLIFSVSVSAEIFKCKEKDGKLRFSDKPCTKGATQEKLEVKSKETDWVSSSISNIELNYSVKVFYQYNAVKYFPPEWLNPPIDARGEQISESEVGNLIPIIEDFLAVYPKNIIEKNLKEIYLLGDLNFYGKRFGATYSAKGLYIKSEGSAKGFTKLFLLSQLHSEFSSILMRNYTFPMEAWSQLNPVGFNYSGNGVEVIENIDLFSSEENLLKNGFLVIYSKSSLENDFNMISFWLFTRPSELKALCINHEILRKKVVLAIEFYRSIGIRVSI